MLRVKLNQVNLILKKDKKLNVETSYIIILL